MSAQMLVVARMTGGSPSVGVEDPPVSSPPHALSTSAPGVSTAAPYRHFRDREALISEAGLAPPNHPQLQKAGKKFVKLLGKALPIMQRMNRYYAQKRYTEDDCFKGRVFHVQLMKIYLKLMGQYEAVYQLIQFQAQGSLQNCIERTENRANKATLHSWASLIQSIQSAMAQFYLENRNPHPDLDAISKIKTQLEEKMKSFDSLPQEMTDTHDMELFEEFLLATSAFREQSAGQKPGEKPLGIRIQNGAPVAVRTGSLSHVLDAFHSLIRRYNFWAKNNCIMLLPCKDDGTCPKW